ncbi:protein of unknown function [Cupriavidus taiwanensis]|nr:protein of unknown function [Cupriavidus taiwanensis]
MREYKNIIANFEVHNLSVSSKGRQVARMSFDGPLLSNSIC